MASNREISRHFNLFAELLLLHQQDEKLSALLSGAAYRLTRLQEEVSGLSKKELAALFRPQVNRFIHEIDTTGTIAVLDELIQLTPAGVFEMMRIRGLGGKKIAVLWREEKIDSVDSLLEAAKSNRLSGIRGFGKKTQANIIESIESYRNQSTRFHYAFVADTASQLVMQLQQQLKTPLISLCGDIRRQTTTVEAIEIIAAVTSTQLNRHVGRAMIINNSAKDKTTGYTLDEIPVIIYHTTRKDFYSELFNRTGTAEHTKMIRAKFKSKQDFDSEEAIYRAAKISYIQPELRENVAEWDFVKRKSELVTADDIKGVVHNHTEWSDGVDRLADFAQACRDKGYEYVVISDHSKNAHYAGGLKPDKLRRQWEEIDLLNKKLAPFHIFKSVECDILVSGELDYEPGILDQLDLVIISIHQLLKMDEQKATSRLIKAIENPYTTILGHMTGRQLLIRPGYPVDFVKVIDACAANNVVIELNANPYRLDMDWSHIPYAMKKGVSISINPDAHSILEIDNIRWGISAARKGGLTNDMTWNAMNLSQVKQWLKKKRKQINR